MIDQRGRALALGLGGVLAVVLLGVVIILASRPAGPTATASPSASATASASPSAGASPSPSPSASASPSLSPGPSPSPAPSPTDLPSPSASASLPPSPSAGVSPSTSPSASPSAPPPSSGPPPTASLTPSPEPLPTSAAGTASIAFLGVGVDGPAADASRDRVFTFTTDAAGIVEASAESGGSEDIRLCLGRGAPGAVSAPQCQVSSAATVTSVASAAETVWTLTLTGAEGAGGTVDLVLGFPSDAPSVTIDGFRFQGTAFDDYNGFLAEVEVSCCSLDLEAEWSGGSAPYRLIISEEGGTVLDESGDGTGFMADAIVGPGTHRIRLSNQQEFAEQDYTLRATISWS